MSILQRQDEILRDVGIDVRPPRLPEPFNLDGIVKCLGKKVRCVEYFTWEHDGDVYITYSSWDDAFEAYRKIHEYYAKNRHMSPPRLTGWRINLNVPSEFKGGVALLDEKIKEYKESR